MAARPARLTDRTRGRACPEGRVPWRVRLSSAVRQASRWRRRYAPDPGIPFRAPDATTRCPALRRPGWRPPGPCTSGTHLVQPIRPTNPRQPANRVASGFPRRFIELDDHEGVATAFLSRKAKRGDVQVILCEDRRDARNGALDVLGDEHDGVLVAGDLHRIAVDLRKQHPSRAE